VTVDLAGLLRHARCAGDEQLADAVVRRLAAAGALPPAERAYRVLVAVLGLERR
jgi:hypothetical protein